MTTDVPTSFATPTLPIPDSRAEITPEWLSQVLAARYSGVEVLSAEVGDFFGYKPNKCRLKVEYNDAGRAAGLPEHLVKGGFQDRRGNDSLTGLDIGLELELLAYTELVPHLDANTPRCLATLFDPQHCRGVMLIEELPPARARFLHSAPSLEYPQAVAFLDAQARFHAQWFDASVFAAGGRFGPDSGLARRTARLHEGYLNRLVRPEHWDSLVALPRGAVLPRRLQDAGRAAAAQEKMNALHRTCAQTIIHGDEHLGNLYLEADGRPGFIDWCARREAWVLGVTYFLVSTLDVLDRRQWERALLQHYLDRLRHYGAPAPGLEEAWYAYRCTALFPFLTWLNNSAKWQPEAINTRNTMRAALAVIDHDSLSLLGV